MDLREEKIIEHHEYNKQITQVNNNMLYDTDFGFIMTRHVNSEKTNNYWNINARLLNKFYPNKLIVIIDDNSNKKYLKQLFKLKDILIIQSKYPKRGELLPYIYFLNNKWFESAVIIHDGIFIHKRVSFEKIKCSVLPLWHFTNSHTKTHLKNNLRLANILKYSQIIKYNLLNNNAYNGCFGVQSFISHKFLVHLNNKYKIQNLLFYVHTREDRCSLERIMGLLFFLETKIKYSLIGDISKQHSAFGYTYENYINDIKKKIIPSYIIKVFTGR
jgi:hypothetical protein